ncbi:hypothetical protein DSL64_15755 [Dyadobacter luteus]|uniref:Uncharacterized protein n=1 Tax=Dyadobacter luteus TaxID=2259619 RepID=A0A3D8Y9E6_9BACT|nr:hypothetical protein [Dyadobacter luteus]REA60129.1 hypothetical protein DSL64_15755 [Dyadobacter luteus]
MARKWALVAIVAIVCVQSFLGYIVYYSLDAPSNFQKEYTQTGEKLETIHNKTKEGLLSLLDYGQKPTQKKQTAPTQLAVSFNLFIHNGQVSLPVSTVTELRTNNSYHYTANYAQAHFEIIPHPPQFS